MRRLSLLIALMVLVTLVGMVGVSRTGIAVSTLQAAVNDGAPAKAKVYYLTVNSFSGGDAITACDSGFHMASLSEIQDPSNLQYATRGTAAYDALVDGEGFEPPSDHMGWVRTGFFPITGDPDYSDFSVSSFDQHSGTTLSLHTQIWGDPYMDPYPTDTETGWHVNQIAYNRAQQVWCVEGPE